MDESLAISYLELDSEALLLNPLPSGCPDTHISLIPEFTIPDGRMKEFMEDFQKFVNATKNGEGASGMFYYGLAVDGNTAYCREGFKVFFNLDIRYTKSLNVKIYFLEC